MIEAVSPESPHYEQVVALGNANSKTLGHLPFAAIKQAAAEGGLLAFLEGGEVKGYALFGKRVRTGDISLTHLCVDQNSRGRGIARALVGAIVERNPHRAGIRLSCRKDYEAHDMWPQLGFRALGERPGRGRDRMPLVTWWRAIAARALFGEPEMEDGRLVVIDTNVLLDILEKRNFPASLALAADWVAEAAELAVTEESRSELSDQRPRSAEFESVLSDFDALEPSQEAWRSTFQSLQDDPDAAGVGAGDLRVVAQASAGGAAYLVSRDDGLLQQAEAIERLTGLNVVGPEDFLLRLHGLGGEHGRQARTIAASGLSVSTVSRMPSKAELSLYCHQRLGERSAELRQRLSIVTGTPSGRIEQLMSDSGESLALGAVHRDEAGARITALRCTSGPQSHAAARQMVHHLRAIVAADGPAVIVVDDLTPSPVDEALRDEGFKPEGSAWRAVVDTRVFASGDPLPQDLEDIGWDRLNAHLVRAYERFAWPSKVFSGTVASYVVPIKPEFARVILGYEEPQGRLIEMNRGAAAARDNVYYRSHRSFECPARLIWWVSGRERLIGGVRAMSWLDEAETGHPRRLHRKYHNYGVLDERQVIGAASASRKDGQLEATAMVFSQTEVFPAPIPIARSRQLCDSMNTRGFFQTAKRIDEDVVRRFYEEGMRSNDG